MAWQLTRSTDSVHVGILTAQGYSQSGPLRLVIGLYPGLFSKDIPAGENPTMALTFLNQFVKTDGNYPAIDFRAPGWVHQQRSSGGVS